MRSQTFAICYAPCSTGMRQAVERIVDDAKNHTGECVERGIALRVTGEP